MNVPDNNLSAEQRERIDELADQFESEYQAGIAPKIEDYLVHTPDLGIHLVRELLTLEIQLGRRAGETPSADHYRNRFPNASELIDELLPATQAMTDAAVTQALEDSSRAFSTPKNVLPTMVGPQGVPRVVLKNAQDGPDPVQRLDSPEIPQHDASHRYQLQGEIDRGGMGAIIKGRDTELGRDLAIKVLLDSHKDNPDVIRRFIEEAQIGGQLQHPGIVPVYELGQFGDHRPFFSMKLVKGKTLAALLAQRSDSSEDRGRYISIFEQVCQTMAYSHSRRVIHRDLKPANIMVGAFGEVQVMDWGLAKVISSEGDSRERKRSEKQAGRSVIQTIRSVGDDTPAEFGSGSDTRMGSVLGTPAYMSPEQALGEIDTTDERADVFGLGAILCEILTGLPPYVECDGMSAFRQATRGRLDPCLARLDQCGADKQLVTLAKQCLELAPDDRPAHAGELATRVSEYLESVESKLRETELERAAEAARLIEARKRHRVSLALAASLLLMIVTGGGGWLYLDKKRTEIRAAAALQVNGALEEARLYQNLAAKIDIEANDGLKLQLRELEQAVRSASTGVKLATNQQVDARLLEKAKALHSKLKEQAIAVRSKASQRVADLALREELESIRLRQSAPETITYTATAEGMLDATTASSLYADAFRRANLDLAAADAETVAKHINSSFIRESLISALDDWARARSRAKVVTAKPTADEILAIAHSADSNPWRRSVREALVARETTELSRLVDQSNIARQSPTLIAWAGASLREAKFISKSIHILSEARFQFPDDFWLNYELGQSLYWSGQKIRGIGFLRAATSIRPQNSAAAAALAFTLRYGGHPDDAVLEYKRALEIDPESADLRRGLAWTLFGSHKFREAEVILKEASILSPDDDNVLITLGIALSNQGKHKEAAAEYEKAVEAGPDNMEALTRYAECLNLIGEKEKAVAAARKAIEIDPSRHASHRVLGDVLASHGEFAEAEAAFRQAIRLYPKAPFSFNGLANALSNQQQTEAAVNAYKRSIELDPNHYYPYWRLGQIFESKNELNEALQWYRKSRQRAPQRASTHVVIANILERQRETETVGTAAAADAATSLFFISRGKQFMSAGELGQALTEFQKAAQVNPKDSNAHYYCCLAQQRIGDVSSEAITAAKEALKCNSRHLGARHQLSLMLIADGNREEAEELLREGLMLSPGSPLLQTLLDHIDGIPGFSGSYSATGERIVFRSKSRIVVARQDGSMRRTLTQGIGPLWSPTPDGPIAFIRDANDAKKIFLMNADGRDERQIALGSFLAGWTSDGSDLFFVRDNALYSINVREANAKPEKRMDRTSVYPAVSPNGKWIAQPVGERLSIREIDTAIEIASWPIPKWEGLLAGWSPDSRYVGFGSAYGRQGLWILDVQTGKAFAAIPESGTLPRWSWDGDRILYDIRTSGNLLRVAETANLPWPDDWEVTSATSNTSEREND